MKQDYENNDDLVLATYANEFVALGIIKKKQFSSKKVVSYIK